MPPVHREMSLWALFLLIGEGHTGERSICIAGSGRSAARGDCQNPVALAVLWRRVKGCTGCLTMCCLFHFPVCASSIFFSLKYKKTFNRQPGPRIWRGPLKSPAVAEGTGRAAGAVAPWGRVPPDGAFIPAWLNPTLFGVPALHASVCSIFFLHHRF